MSHLLTAAFKIPNGARTWTSIEALLIWTTWMNKSWGRRYFSLSDSTGRSWLRATTKWSTCWWSHKVAISCLTRKPRWLTLPGVPVWTTGGVVGGVWFWRRRPTGFVTEVVWKVFWRRSASAGQAQQAPLLPLWRDLQPSPERSHQTVQGAPLSPGWLWAGAVDVWVPWQELPSLPVLLQQPALQRHEER